MTKACSTCGNTNLLDWYYPLLKNEIKLAQQVLLNCSLLIGEVFNSTDAEAFVQMYGSKGSNNAMVEAIIKFSSRIPEEPTDESPEYAFIFYDARQRLIQSASADEAFNSQNLVCAISSQMVKELRTMLEKDLDNIYSNI